MLSVLYVDDDPSLLNLGKIFLEMSGKLRIDTAASVGEALDKVKQQKYDGIISDYEMPGINGIEFLRHVRQHYRDLPFILFTGKGREEIAIEALNSGADFYLQKGGEQKPQFVELEHKLLTAIDRNRMRDDLKESRQQLSDLIDFLPDATFAINRENKVISWNRMMEKMTGVPPDAVLGTGKYLDALSVINEEPVPLVDIVLKDDKTREGAHPNLVWNGDKLTSELYSPTVYDGKGAFLWRIASPLYDSGGSVIGAIESIRDITSRKEAEEKLKSTNEELNAAYEQLTATEEELRQNYDELTRNQQALVQSEERYRNVVEDQTEFICRFSPDSRLTFVNGAYCRYFGLDARTCLGKPHTVIISPDDQVRVKQHLSALTRENPVGIIDHRITMPSGEVRWQRWSDRAVFDHNGRITEYQSVGMDITGQKDAEDKLRSTHEELNAAYEQLTATEEELRANYDELTKNQQELLKSEERYRNVVEDQTEFICRFLPDGTHVFVNDAYCRYFGLKREEIIGHRFRPVVPEEDGLRIKKMLAALTPENPVNFIRQRVIFPDGSVRWQRWVDRAIHDNAGNLIEYQSVGRDITDIMTAEQALSESEERYRNVVEDQTEFICRFLPDGTHVFVNDAYCRYFGLKREEIIGHRFRPEIPAEDQDCVNRIFTSLTPDHPVDFIEHRITMPSGEMRWQRWSDRAVFDKNGRITEYQSVGMDITGQKNAEEKLRSTHEELNAAYEQLTATEEELRQNYDELTKNQQALLQSEERYRNVVEDQTEFICRFSPDGRLTFVNGAYCRYFGLDAKTCLGKPHTVVISPDDQVRVKQHLSVLTLENPVGIIEHRITMPSGEVRWQRWSDRAVFDQTGRITEYQSVGMDITGQKDAEEKLRSTHVELNAAYEQLTATEEELRQNYDELAKNQQALVQSEERYRNVVEDQTEFICRFSPDGRHIFVNNAYCRYFGKTREELIGHKFVPDIPEEDHPLIAAHFVSIRPDHPVQTIEHRIRMPSGEIRWQQWSDRAIFEKDGRVTEYQSVGRDITDRRHKDQALHEANRKLNLLSSITRHDILNQLTALQGYFGLLEGRITDPGVRDLLKRAMQTGEVIRGQILFTQQYEDMGLQNPHWQDLPATIAAVLADGGFSPVNVDASLNGIEVFADPLLKQVFYNLFENAFMHGGHVTRIEVNGHEVPGGFDLVVADDGCGIPPADKQNIFVKGFGSHTGLGLFLTQEILTITSLTIRETGEYGQGARFEIHIPAARLRKASGQVLS